MAAIFAFKDFLKTITGRKIVHYTEIGSPFVEYAVLVLWFVA
jgi:hypothetical protein